MRSGLEYTLQEVLLADLEAVLPQDVVGGRGVEIEVRDGEAGEIGHAGHRRRRGGAAREGDLSGEACIERRAVGRIDEGQRLGDALLQLREALFLIGEARVLAARKARDRVLGEIAAELDRSCRMISMLASRRSAATTSIASSIGGRRRRSTVAGSGTSR